jgi:hypothetical protein
MVKIILIAQWYSKPHYLTLKARLQTRSKGGKLLKASDEGEGEKFEITWSVCTLSYPNLHPHSERSRSSQHPTRVRE